MKLSICLAVAAVSAASIASPTLAADAMKGMAMGGTQAKTGHATGVVTAVDAKANTVTIKHGAIPTVGWPAMTMTFKATSASLIKGVKAGDRIAFDVKVQGGSNEVTTLKKQ